MALAAATEACLILHSDRPITADLERLAVALPPGLVARAVVDDISATDDGKEWAPPQVVAYLADASEGDLAAIRRALDQLSSDDLELQTGPPELACRPGKTGVPDLPAAFFGCTDTALQEAEARLLSVREDLERILAAKRTGVPFPEQGYAGEDRLAYDELVRRLGREPVVDRGTYLYPSDVDKAAQSRPGRIAKAAWEAVAAHLSREVRFFRLADRWLGSAGYVHNLLQDQRVFDDDFVTQLNDRYLGLPDSKQVTIGLDVCMGLTVRAVGTVPVYGFGLGALIGALWTATKPLLPDPQARITAAIAQCRAQVFETFRESIRALETAQSAMVEDWGLLDTFGALVEDGALIWPTDLTALRAAKSRAFHFVTLRDTLHLKTGFEGTAHVTFGVVENRHAVKGKQDGRWERYHYLTHSVWNKGKCGAGAGWYVRECYLGKRVFYPNARLPVFFEAEPALEAKLFGKNTGDPDDPQFALAAGFLIDPEGKGDGARAGWNLPQMRSDLLPD